MTTAEIGEEAVETPTEKRRREDSFKVENGRALTH